MEMEKHVDEAANWESKNLKLFEWECADQGVLRYNFEMAQPGMKILARKHASMYAQQT